MSPFSHPEPTPCGLVRPADSPSVTRFTWNGGDTGDRTERREGGDKLPRRCEFVEVEVHEAGDPGSQRGIRRGVNVWLTRARRRVWSGGSRAIRMRSTWERAGPGRYGRCIVPPRRRGAQRSSGVHSSPPVPPHTFHPSAPTALSRPSREGHGRVVHVRPSAPERQQGALLGSRNAQGPPRRSV